MRTITFNKLDKKTFCLRCKKNLVPVAKSMRPCDDCVKAGKQSESGGVVLGRRQPAAIIKPDGGGEVYVDKFGKEVDNPGYDLKNDPRGWGHTGTRPKVRSVIK